MCSGQRSEGEKMKAIPKLCRDWVGLKVKSRVRLTSGRYDFPSGTIFNVRDKFGGLELQSIPCEHCGISGFINKVPIGDVEILCP